MTFIGGCGSTGDGVDGNDRLILRPTGFNSDGLTQQDEVRGNSADIDVAQNLCVQEGGTSGDTMVTQEVFTQTAINATFVNNQRQDIFLDTMVVHFDDQRVGFGDLTQSINATIIGGRCSSSQDRACAVQADCPIGERCTFSETQATSLLLIDFLAKAAVQPSVWGESIPARITFSGTDVNNHHYQVTTGYTVTFDNFCNCDSGELCCNSLEECGL
jgi:hypothetical protein